MRCGLKTSRSTFVASVGAKLNSDETCREATRRLEETKARHELEVRLSTGLVDLEAARDARQKLADELAARDIELEELRRRQTVFDRDFRGHVELRRQLREEREQNERLRRKLELGGNGLVKLCADGKLR